MGRNQQTRGRGADSALPRLLGERLCLNFVNTIESPRGAHPEEFLRGYADLVRWGRHVGLLTDSERERLQREGERRPDAANATFARALALRAALTQIFHAVAEGNAPEEADLQQLQTAFLAALERARLAPGGERYGWSWDADDAALDRPLWGVARSAVAVLTEDDLARVKACPGVNDCGWLFYDTSKNGRRRWCSMEGCGSRVKMRQHYARRRAAEVARAD